MSRPGMILDYASPRKRSALRVASQSVLECDSTADGAVVREFLADRGGAVAAIVMSAMSVALLAGVAWAERRRMPAEWLVGMGVVIGSWLVTAPLVVQRNWGWTELGVGDGRVRLSMGGPLASRRFAWDVGQITALRVIVLPGARPGGYGPRLAEIELLAEGAPPIRLFTDHLEDRLTDIARVLEAAMSGEWPPLASPADESGGGAA